MAKNMNSKNKAQNNANNSTNRRTLLTAQTAVTAQIPRTQITAATAQILRMQIAETITKGFREGTAWRCLFYLQDSVLGAWHTLNGFSFFTYTVIEGGEWKEWI